MSKAYAPITALILNVVEESITFLLYPKATATQSISGKNLKEIRRLQRLSADLTMSNLTLTVDVLSKSVYNSILLCPCPKDCDSGQPVCCPCNPAASPIDGFIYDPDGGSVALFDCNDTVINMPAQSLGVYETIDIDPKLNLGDICYFTIGSKKYVLKPVNKNPAKAAASTFESTFSKGVQQTTFDLYIQK